MLPEGAQVLESPQSRQLPIGLVGPALQVLGNVPCLHPQAREHPTIFSESGNKQKLMIAGAANDACTVEIAV